MATKKNPTKKKPAGFPKLDSAVCDWPGGVLHEVPGFRTVAIHCGLKRKKHKPDLALWVADAPAAAAGVFTTNRVCAAPVDLCRAHLKASGGRVKAVVVNAGNANACTGVQGEKDALAMANLAAKAVGCPASQVQVCSTGIIGRLMPMKKLERGIGKLGKLLARHGNYGDFARAIMTTDLVPKTAAVKVKIGQAEVRIAGATKGSGMIAPNMATTLGFVATDARISPKLLQKALSDANAETMNCLTVDGDTSTNDTLLVLASGKAAHAPVTSASSAAYRAFVAGLHRVLDRLAYLIAEDGEGASHTVTVYVGGTRNDADARQIAATISNSPLVKTAIAGNDPNWGRIVAAAGRSGVAFEPGETSLLLNGVEIFRDGMPTRYNADKLSASLKRSRETGIVLLVGHGPGRAKYYTCDLTHGYISINADYHT
ncbi:MAG: bifunctional glutamate N-acetyltransferase/amino-acid acetyltransferase ArgJ [Planctomycetes bacterium]|nr:bifunctional glutamate N-acetyltransferase/amino-acid acetyltransferase ArgJ [Planctomycetota bacterium]